MDRIWNWIRTSLIPFLVGTLPGIALYVISMFLLVGVYCIHLFIALVISVTIDFSTRMLIHKYYVYKEKEKKTFKKQLVSYLILGLFVTAGPYLLWAYLGIDLVRCHIYLALPNTYISYIVANKLFLV